MVGLTNLGIVWNADDTTKRIEMKLADIMKILQDLVDKKVSGVLTIIFHEGGVRKAKIETELK